MASRKLGLTVAVIALAVSGCTGKWPFGGGDSGSPAASGSASASASASAQPLVGTPVNSGSPGVAVAPPVSGGGASVDFGDDSSRFSKDGECDDKRFSGPGMTSTPLLDSDVGHDATDCRSAYNANRLTYVGYSGGGGAAVPHSNDDITRIQWGDDSSKYSKDGECDDKRFTGPGMTSTPLLESDIQHDATDCRAAYSQGRLSLRG